jgi:Domain of unknown function (DUF4350)
MALLAAGLAFVAPPQDVSGGGIPSVYSTGPDGARAAYLLLRQLRYPVKVWSQPPSELPEDSHSSILILADPTSNPTADDRNALARFVRSGGRILFTGHSIGDFFDGSSVVPQYFGLESHTYHRNLPTNFTHQAPEISLASEGMWTSLSHTQFALYGTTPDVGVIRWRIREGEILWMAGPEPLTNKGISHSDNLNLFLNVMGERTRDSAIFWDEYFHGEGDSLWSYFAATPLPWGLWQLALIAFAILFSLGRRSGPIASPAPVSRRSPLEYVDTLGGLYERAHAEPAIVQIVYDHFRVQLKRLLRLSPATPDADLQKIASTRLGAKEEAFADALNRAATASRAAKISPAQAFKIVRDLESYEESFKLKKR